MFLPSISVCSEEAEKVARFARFANGSSSFPFLVGLCYRCSKVPGLVMYVVRRFSHNCQSSCMVARALCPRLPLVVSEARHALVMSDHAVTPSDKASTACLAIVDDAGVLRPAAHSRQ